MSRNSALNLADQFSSRCEDGLCDAYEPVVIAAKCDPFAGPTGPAAPDDDIIAVTPSIVLTSRAARLRWPAWKCWSRVGLRQLLRVNPASRASGVLNDCVIRIGRGVRVNGESVRGWPPATTPTSPIVCQRRLSDRKLPRSSSQVTSFSLRQATRSSPRLGRHRSDTIPSKMNMHAPSGDVGTLTISSSSRRDW